eukprot:jgi/Bigna1/65471/fgenesh1_kg.110_\
MAEIEAAKAAREAQLQAEREARRAEKARIAEEKTAAFLERKAKEDEERRIRQELEFKEQMRKWHLWKNDKQDEMKEEL